MSQAQPPEPLLYTVEEAAQRLGISRTHTYNYVLSGELQSIKLGRSRRVPAIALRAFVQRLADEAESA